MQLSSALLEQDDLALLKRMAHHDESALDILYARHAPALLGYLLNLVGERFEAEEILQDTFVAAWKSACRFQGRSQVRTWLFSIAHRQTRDRHRRHSLAVAPEFDVSIVEDVAQTSSRLAVLAAGKVIFQGPTTELLAAAHGQVWMLDTKGPAPAGDLTVVSALNAGAGMRYRVVAKTPPAPSATPVEPNLEDGYVALMRGTGRS